MAKAKRKPARKAKRKPARRAKKTAKRKPARKAKKAKRKGKAFGGMKIKPDDALGKVIGKGAVAPSQMTKKIWTYIKRKKLMKK